MSLSSAPPVLLWFRQDLRLDDNPALRVAVGMKAPLICLYILDDETPGNWAMGGASRWWLHHSLAAFARRLEAKGQTLILRRGAADTVIQQLAAETGAKAVLWNRLYDPASVSRDKRLKEQLQKDGLDAQSFNARLLREPWEIRNKSGDPFRVFTPFWRAARAAGPMTAPEAAPDTLPPPVDGMASDRLEDWALLPTKPDWAGGLRAFWTPGEDGALSRFAHFRECILDGYESDRDRPDRDGTSRLSPHLHFGEISPRRLWQSVEGWRHGKDGPHAQTQADKFLAELGWREFSHSLLFYNPGLPDESLREDFRAFPWENNETHLNAWQSGQTGYPIVDAGMRQLWATGWMHNRVRMVVGSLLVKHLLQPWQAGEAWFWDTLVDADLANNSAGWQWIAGCGADAAPYFRVFNPMLQGEKFDPDGAYVRHWVPELAKLPAKHIHKPWEAPALVLAEAGIRLGKEYPEPIIAHGKGRERALAAFQSIKGTAA